MIDIAKGRWWDLPWSLISGCTPCSPGCERCWAASMEHRMGARVTRHVFEAHIPSRFTSLDRKFNGKIKVHPDRLTIPLRRRKPTVWAVWNDLFHEAVPDQFIAEAYSVMWSRGWDWWVKDEESKGHGPGHTFLVLTKRHERMARLLTSDSFWEKVVKAGCLDSRGVMPVPFIFHGLTVCNQAEADEKIPVFLQVPGKKFLSIEPMLGAVKIPPRFLRKDCADMCSAENRCEECSEARMQHYGPRLIDAVILGGETGPGARPLHPDWVRSVRDQCAAAGVPFFFKQWGEWMHESHNDFESSPAAALSSRNAMYHSWPGGSRSFRVGKERAGRLLDGRTHDELPWRAGA